MDKLGPTKEEVRSIVGHHLAQQYVRGRSETDPSTELDRLHAILVDAAQLYDSGQQQQRQAVCDSIEAVSNFLHEQGFNVAALRPFTRARSALVDLNDQNLSDKLFCERAKKHKPSMGMQYALLQGQIGSITEAWLKAHKMDAGNKATKLERAARQMSGQYFGTLKPASLGNAMSYCRQPGHHEILYLAYQQMNETLAAEANVAGGGSSGLRMAVDVQIIALNARPEPS